MARWTLDDIPWWSFDRDAVDDPMVRLAKAAALVEHNGADYARYLCNVFADDPLMCESVKAWGDEEIRHGEALGRWAAIADSTFDFQAACRRFADGYRIPINARRSVRGSQSAELVARCVVEVGTSAYYTALGRRCREPALAAICTRIAADEFRHYKMFYAHLSRYKGTDKASRWHHLFVALGRVFEVGDDELSFAWHCANEPEVAYDRRRCHRSYAHHASAYYDADVIARGTAMILKATGFSPGAKGVHLAAWFAQRLVRMRCDVRRG